jgi:hypothetical protein
MNKRRRIVGMGLRVALSAGAMLAATTFGIDNAHAGLTQIQDSFNEPSTWSTYFSGGSFGFSIGPSPAARTAPNLGSIVSWGGGSANDWAMISKVFFWNNTQGGGDHPVFTGCGARVYVKRNGNIAAAVSGQVELINTITGTYVGTKAFSLAANSTAWTSVSVGGTSSTCSPWLTFRVVLPSNTQFKGVLMDDMTLQWYF